MASFVHSLHVYPVKGCRGIDTQRARLSSTGFAYDRHWVIIDERNNKFTSQRSLSQMARIETALPDEVFAAEDNNVPADAALTVAAPGQEPLQVPIASLEGELRDASVWAWEGKAKDEGDLVAEYLSDFLGKKTRLVRYAGNPGKGTPKTEATRRQVDEDWVPEGVETAYPDAFPFLIANQASLEDLNSRMEKPLPMNRFRANIVVAGAQPWEEDSWELLHIGGRLFHVPQPCGRCKVTTTNQETGEVDKTAEPLRTLSSFRTGKLLNWDADPTFRNLSFFGWNAYTEATGLVTVGDEVDVVGQRTGPPQLIHNR